MKLCLIVFVLLALVRFAIGATLISVPPAMTFRVYWSNTVTNVIGTNWTSPALNPGSNSFCVKTVEYSTNESDCATGYSLNTVAKPHATLTWSAPATPPVPNIVAVGGFFESSTDLQHWRTAFAFTEKYLTNPTPNVLNFRISATIK